MRVFIMHVGNPGNVDIKDTVTRSREIDEVVKALPDDAPELTYFRDDQALRAAFPDGRFNCWGVPNRAEPSFRKTDVGDAVLIIPEIGLGGGIEHIGIVKAACPDPCWRASRVLWPDTPYERLFPWLFFFETETGLRRWDDFLDDMEYDLDWNPRGWYRPIAAHRFAKWGGPERYLARLRTDGRFQSRRGADD